MSDAAMPSTRGEIITFYSYKGGTGRSMALANVGWILASHGKRVLLIDWDFEAPGLHRYLHPFLEDQELTSSPGLIDYFVEFSQAAAAAACAPKSAENAASTMEWHEPFLSLLRYTYSLDWDFGAGTLDLVPSGQQGPGYAQRVGAFNWHDFFGKLGGGVLLERLKQTLRKEYDYVLIDSRTGLSDTSGICTVQMPDQLVVCFTLNRQSVLGSAAVAASADSQRRRETGEPSLRIWPLVTRVDHAEKERLDAARTWARGIFQGYLGHLPRASRPDYWGETEVLHQAYFAYEEVLAVFAEQRKQRASMLSSLEGLTRYLSRNTVTGLASMSEASRHEGLLAFQRINAHVSKRIFVAYAVEDSDSVSHLCRALEPVLVAHSSTPADGVIWYDQEQILPGDDVQLVLEQALQNCDIVLACFGRGWAKRAYFIEPLFEKQLADARRLHKKIVPVLLPGLAPHEWRVECGQQGFEDLTRLLATSIASEDSEADVVRLGGALLRLLAQLPSALPPSSVPDDPNKGRWGGEWSRGSRLLSAQISPLSADWFLVTIRVEQLGEAPLTGTVEFHLHPTFSPDVHLVEARDGVATLEVSAWGAFTVGVCADNGSTLLELDLSDVPDAPARFAER